jgi:hypothetical protein
MPRRALAAAAAAVLIVTVLTGCRSDPRVAAYVNGKTITEAQVDSMVADAKKVAERNAAQVEAAGGTPVHVPTRAEAVSVLATQEITRQTLADKNLTKAQVDPSQVAQQFGVPAGSGYASALTDIVAGIIALEDAVGNNAQPSDAELRDVYDRAVAKGLAAPGTFDQVKPQLLQVNGLPQDISARNELASSAAHAGVTVNPRYAPLEFPVETLSTQDGRSFVAVALPLGATAGNGAVRSAPTPAASAAD